MRAVNLQRVASFRVRISGLVRRATMAVAAVALMTAAAGHAPADRWAAPAPAANQPTDAEASLRPEVRLRKLHLVRPDLIQYPLAYDIYC